MDGLLERLVENLDDEKRIYTELLKLSEQKKEVILEKKIRELEKIVQLEQEFIIHIGRLENERQEIVESLAAQKNINAEEVTISTLISWASGQLKLQLEKIKEEFADIIEKQRALNQINEKLLKINLEYVDFAINFLAGNSGSVYEKQGQASQVRQNRNLFDKKV